MKLLKILAVLATTLLLALLLAACADETPTLVATIIPPPSGSPNAIAPTAPHPTVVSGTVNPTAATTTPSQPANVNNNELTVYFPAAADASALQTFTKYAADFTKANPEIKINVIPAGSYADVLKKVQANKNGAQADVAIMCSSDLYTLIDSDVVVPLDDFIANTKGGDAYIKDFYPAFMLNSQANGKTWSIPFQRNIPLLYYNKDAFKDVGLDPNKPPTTFKEMAEDAQKLTKPDGSRYGIKIPTDGFPYWLLQSLAIANGENVVGEAANKVTFNTAAVTQGLTDIKSLVTTYKAMPKGNISWNDIPADFVKGYTAMAYYPSDIITNSLAKAPFNVGVSMLPAGTKGYGAATGGGNLYILKSNAAQKQQVAFRFIQFLTDPVRLADWMQATDYLAPRKTAWDTAALKLLTYTHPQYLVARDELQYAQKELATHQSAAVQQILDKAVQAVMLEDKDPAVTLSDAQSQADKLLADYKN